MPPVSPGRHLHQAGKPPENPVVSPTPAAHSLPWVIETTWERLMM